MIANMEDLYRYSNPPTPLVQRTTNTNNIPYWEGTCPNCGRQALHIYINSTKAYCYDCNSSWSMFAFCKDVLQIEGDDMVRFILGKNSPVNDFDYRQFAKVVHSSIFSAGNEETEYSYFPPDDREPVAICQTCGGGRFVYRITKSSVKPYCLYCGSWQPCPRKTKNVGKNRRGNDCSDWRKAVWNRYNGKCALCGSTNGCEAHHIVPYSVCEEHRYNIDNGILLCKYHHDLIHTNPIYIHKKAPACAGA